MCRQKTVLLLLNAWLFPLRSALDVLDVGCSSVSPVLTRSALRIMARASNIAHVKVSSGLPFEPKRDRTYGQCRAPELNCCVDWNEL
jgi:hypothetical protein